MPHPHSDSARDRLHDALTTLHQTIAPEEFPAVEKWQIGYGPGSRRYERAPYWSHMDGHDGLGTDSQTTVLRFFYSPTGSTVYSEWVSHTNYIVVRFGSDWDPAYNQDDDGETVIPQPEAGPTGSPRVADKYMIGGPLCDPVVTGHVETAIEAVYDQLSRVKAGGDINHLFEVLAANRTRTLTAENYRETLPDLDELPDDLFSADVDATSPIHSISGIGTTTIKRFASRFGVYPNLREAAQGDFSGLLPGYSHSPDLDEMDTVIAALTEHYATLSDGPDWPTAERRVDQFTGYPVGNPLYHSDI